MFKENLLNAAVMGIGRNPHEKATASSKEVWKFAHFHAIRHILPRKESNQICGHALGNINVDTLMRKVDVSDEAIILTILVMKGGVWSIEAKDEAISATTNGSYEAKTVGNQMCAKVPRASAICRVANCL